MIGLKLAKTDSSKVVAPRSFLKINPSNVKKAAKGSFARCIQRRAKRVLPHRRSTVGFAMSLHLKEIVHEILKHLAVLGPSKN